MDATSHCTDSHRLRDRNPSYRRDSTARLAQFQQLDAPGVSCRQIASQIHVPPRTLSHCVRCHWRRIRESSWPEDVVRFLDSPHGLEFLHQVWTAVHLVFVQANVEEYQPQRDAATWNQALDQRLAGMPINVVQVTSDEAKALIAHTEIHLGAHHSPDLFHVQQETSRATSLALESQTKAACEEQAKAQAKAAALRAQEDACRQACPESTLPEEIASQIRQAEAEVAAAGRRIFLGDDCHTAGPVDAGRTAPPLVA